MRKRQEITAYNVIESKKRKTLIELVSREIVNGWQPCGGVTMLILNSGHPTYCQAMVRYKKEGK